MTSSSRSRLSRTGTTIIPALVASVLLGAGGWQPAHAGIVVTPTVDPGDLASALNASGLNIISVLPANGAASQFGTYSDFNTQPITIGDGVVLSTGDVSAMAPPADPVLDFPQPSFDTGMPGTAEFDAYGPGHIENFQNSNDVAVLEVQFHLDQDSQIKFDFVFGSVEYPYWVGDYTDSFLAFLDGQSIGDQITYDANGIPVQVGSSFGGLVSTADHNTAFADPHGLIGLTTTSGMLTAGDHTLWFEIGDVNDHILDSAVFIANLRTGQGEEGTEVTDPEDYGVPEPATTTLALLGLATAGWSARGHRRAAC